MAQKIIITVTNDLVTDNRVHRMASTLYEEGFDVILVGRELPHSQSIVRNYATKRFRLWFTKGFMFYAQFNLRLFFYLCFHKFDKVVANDLDTLPACYFASKLKNKVLFYDSHEYFTEVPELQGRIFQQNFWLFIEKKIVPKIKNAYTVSYSIASEYEQKYGIKFHVIRNLPIKKEELNETKTNAIVYQGAINMGRGIELMIQTMEYLPGWELWIAGKGDIEEKLHEQVTRKGLQKSVKFFGQIPLEQLHLITSKAKLGLSLEENMGKNYYYALPNKLFDYIQARIPVLVSDLPEMRHIVEKYGVGEVIDQRNPQSLANQIKNVLLNSEFSNLRKNNLDRAALELCWENEKEKLIKLFRED